MPVKHTILLTKHHQSSLVVVGMSLSQACLESMVSILPAVHQFLNCQLSILVE